MNKLKEFKLDFRLTSKQIATFLKVSARYISHLLLRETVSGETIDKLFMRYKEWSDKTIEKWERKE
jgi:hypothetical protein